MVLTQKIIWEHLNCAIFVEKVYVRLNKNEHDISIKIIGIQNHRYKLPLHVYLQYNCLAML